METIDSNDGVRAADGTLAFSVVESVLRTQSWSVLITLLIFFYST